jgi:hypothetical protein
MAMTMATSTWALNEDERTRAIGALLKDAACEMAGVSTLREAYKTLLSRRSALSFKSVFLNAMDKHGVGGEGEVKILHGVKACSSSGNFVKRTLNRQFHDEVGDLEVGFNVLRSRAQARSRAEAREAAKRPLVETSGEQAGENKRLKKASAPARTSRWPEQEMTVSEMLGTIALLRKEIFDCSKALGEGVSPLESRPTCSLIGRGAGGYGSLAGRIGLANYHANLMDGMLTERLKGL